jgi:tRNA nucleotidyltransferase (CCA-adding enzyme)
MLIKTVTQRKAEKVAAIAAALSVLRPDLERRGRELGGRFLLYGSAARGELRHDSDVDLLLDFPDHASSRAAWDFVEARCAELDLACDIRPLEWCGESFLAHVLPGAVSLP